MDKCDQCTPLMCGQALITLKDLADFAHVESVQI